jgi:hypothetical protein
MVLSRSTSGQARRAGKPTVCKALFGADITELLKERTRLLGCCDTHCDPARSTSIWPRTSDNRCVYDSTPCTVYFSWAYVISAPCARKFVARARLSIRVPREYARVLHNMSA